jgi:hypothetical protein
LTIFAIEDNGDSLNRHFEELLLELLRRKITNGGVASLPIIESFEVAKNFALSTLPCCKGTVMYQLSLERSKERFCDRVIVTAPRGAHSLHSSGPLHDATNRLRNTAILDQYEKETPARAPLTKAFLKAVITNSSVMRGFRSLTVRRASGTWFNS